MSEEYITVGLIVAVIVLGIIALIKNEVTYRNNLKIIDAILMYQINTVRKGCFPKEDLYRKMKSYGRCLFNIFDWGYKNILPPEDYEKVKKYISI